VNEKQLDLIVRRIALLETAVTRLCRFITDNFEEIDDDGNIDKNYVAVAIVEQSIKNPDVILELIDD
jgi:hypothetical protein